MSITMKKTVVSKHNAIKNTKKFIAKRMDSTDIVHTKKNQL